MKNICYIVIATAILLTCFIVVKAQTADEIIQKHLTAIGGLDNWKKITSLKITGIINTNGSERTVTITTLKGKGWRMEISMNGMVNYRTLTTTEGWVYFPTRGQAKPEAMTTEDVKKSQDQLEIGGPLVDYQAKGNKVTYLGKDDVEGTECYKLKVVNANGKEETIYIDASNYYNIRTVSKINSNGKEQEVTTNYGNFQQLPEGIVFAMSSGGNRPMEIKTIEINKPVDENIFKPGK